jgi:cyanophycinase
VSIHLVGGGLAADAFPAVYGGFVTEALEAVRRRDETAGAPRVAVVTVREPGDLRRHADDLAAALRSAGAVQPAITAIAEGGSLDAGVFDDVDGIVIGGGLTPAYLAALAPHAERIRALVESGIPYLGFSAGAMIAPDRALIGGWRIGGVEVSPEDGSEDLDEVTLATGLGLIDVSVDVHAVQWGNLGRLLAGVDAGLIDSGIAIDENTVLVVGTGALVARGAGTVWTVTRGEDASQVRALRGEMRGAPQ